MCVCVSFCFLRIRWFQIIILHQCHIIISIIRARLLSFEFKGHWRWVWVCACSCLIVQRCCANIDDLSWCNRIDVDDQWGDTLAKLVYKLKKHIIQSTTWWATKFMERCFCCCYWTCFIQVFFVVVLFLPDALNSITGTASG
jgi:hypothetical protein